MPKYLHLKISLKHIKPAIWRTLLVNPSLSFDDLNVVCLYTMGWEGGHLYEFKVGKRSIGAPDDEGLEMEDATGIVFSSVLKEKGDTITYIYDFGDCWEHKIEMLGHQEEKDIFLARCLDGKRACPPEDCGGVSGYEAIVESMRHPNSKEYKENLEWLGGPYDPEKFDLKETNAVLKSLEDDIVDYDGDFIDDYDDEEDDDYDDEEDDDYDDEEDDDYDDEESPVFQNPKSFKYLNRRTLLERDTRVIAKLMENAKSEKDVEAIIKKFNNKKIPEWTPQGEKEQAMDLCYQAMEEENPIKRKQLVNKALKLDPDCAEAYNLLAGQASTIPDAYAYFSKAVTAGEKSLGKKFFEEEKGYFWGLVETRPYMRALAGKMGTATGLKKYEEAIGICRRMLELNPSDNQGIRTTYASLLLLTKKIDELNTLINKTFKDEKGTAVFTRFALSYLKEQDNPATQKLFKAAEKENKYLFPLFASLPELDHHPEPFTLGSEEEAYGYYYDMLEAWLSVPGLVEYVAAKMGKESPVKGEWQVVSSKAGKVGRNEPCPCGSGKKYKHCCGK